MIGHLTFAATSKMCLLCISTILITLGSTAIAQGKVSSLRGTNYNHVLASIINSCDVTLP